MAATCASSSPFSPRTSAGPPTLPDLAALAPRDVRAFLAERRAAGLDQRSLGRVLAGVRSFGRFLERNGLGKVGALQAVSTPKAKPRLPRPLRRLGRQGGGRRRHPRR